MNVRRMVWYLSIWIDSMNDKFGTTSFVRLRFSERQFSDRPSQTIYSFNFDFNRLLFQSTKYYHEIKVEISLPASMCLDNQYLILFKIRY